MHCRTSIAPDRSAHCRTTTASYRSRSFLFSLFSLSFLSLFSLFSLSFLSFFSLFSLFFLSLFSFLSLSFLSVFSLFSLSFLMLILGDATNSFHFASRRPYQSEAFDTMKRAGVKKPRNIPIRVTFREDRVVSRPFL